jgi:hypothetical protein
MKLDEEEKGKKKMMTLNEEEMNVQLSLCLT